MAALVLVVYFAVFLAFSGYAGEWRLFDLWCGGGAVICGALLFHDRPLRFHRLGFFLLPAIIVLVFSRVFTAGVVHNAGWFVLAFFLFLFIPTVSHPDLAEKLFAGLRWLGGFLTILYIIQILYDLPVRGFGLTRSAEAQVLIGGVAACLMKEGGPSTSLMVGGGLRWIWMSVLTVGLVLNGSRSGFLGLGLVVGAFFWLKRSLSLGALAGIAAAALTGVLTYHRIESNPYAELRPQIFTLALILFSEFPFGSGIGTFLTESFSKSFPVSDPMLLSQYASKDNHAHNAALQWAAEGGVLGMAAVLAFLLCAVLLLFRTARSQNASWPSRTALIWAPAFILELMINTAETFPHVRWMGLAGLTAVTAECSVVVLRRSNAVFRLGLIAAGVAMLYLGMSDLFAREAVRVGIKEEGAWKFESAMESYESARRIRPWDEQPLLHLADAALELGRPADMDGFLQRAIQTGGNPAAVLYHGGMMYARAGLWNQSRHFMLALSEVQACEVPRALEAAAWSRSSAEHRWRLRRALALEPRAARVYDELSGIARKAGDVRHAGSFSAAAGRIRDFYGPIVQKKLAERARIGRNTSRYDTFLIAGGRGGT